MSATLVAAPDASANSFVSVEYADSYFANRLFSAKWDDADDKAAALITATQAICFYFTPRRDYVPAPNGAGYYRTAPTWTGLPTDSSYSLPWPRTGMLNLNGGAIGSTEIPRELKDATCELALHLLPEDRFLDNDTTIKGISSVKAGSVEISFNKDILMTKVMPQVIQMKLVQSWFTNETMEYAVPALFDVL